MKTINLTKGYSTIIDDKDYDYLAQWRWYASVTSKGFVYAKKVGIKNGKKAEYSMSRVIMHTPDGLFCDHINHNTLDNRRSNLRNCTRAENGRNKTPCRKTSRYLGVYRRKSNGKYDATIMINGRVTHLGSFSHDWAAAIKYDTVAKKYHGEFANLNFKF
jgi:hypothetical protein